MNTHVFDLKIIKNYSVFFIIFYVGKEMKISHIKQLNFIICTIFLGYYPPKNQTT